MQNESSTFYERRGFRAVSNLDDLPHGVRSTYARGCRCDSCRHANTAYERERAKARAVGLGNGLVDAGPARTHLLALSRAGIGRRAISDSTDIAESILCKIRSGERTQIRAETERKILRVTEACAADHALTEGKKSMRLIATLLKAGFTKTRIAHEMGYKTHALQLKAGRITVRNAARVQAAHDRLMASDEVLVPAAPTQKRIRQLLDEMFTERQLAAWLDMPDDQLTIPSKRLPLGLEKRVAALHLKLMS